jgi:hypothetical protein
VSTATQGPCKLKVNDARPTRKLSPWPVIALALASATPCPVSSAPQRTHIVHTHTWQVWM